MRPLRLHGLYAITDATLAVNQDLLSQVEQALAGGARIIQYRDKGNEQPHRLNEACALAQLCRRHNALLIINDDVELAAASGADGVHLGRDDMTLTQARKRLGDHTVIGVSCYNQLELAVTAQQSGADYIAFGRFFTSQTKPQAVQADVALLRRARKELDLPLVAIGGITPENGARLTAAGADMLAVIHGVFGQPDIRAACERFQPLFQPENTT